MISGVRRRAGLALALALFSGCFTPPALLDAHHVDLAEARKSYVAGSEPVAIEVAPGVTLRGLFVPSQPDAPVVLHFLESSGSVGAVGRHFGLVTRELADLGYASLLVDYAGVGLSSGDRSVNHLERDALAMWNEALRRAGGDATRVHVRAISVGTIAAALLLKHGERPASMVWIAPVFPENATSRFAHVFYGPLHGWAAGMLFRDIADVDVRAVLKKAQVPGIVLASASDPLLTDKERNALAAALGPAAHLLLRDGGHIQLSIEAHALLREEAQLFTPCTTPDAARARTAAVVAALPVDVAARFAPGREERGRLERLCAVQRGEPALTIAAAAIAIERPSIATRFLWMLARRSYESLDFADLCAVLSLDDPAGELPIDLIERTSSPSDLVEQFGGARVLLRASQIAAAARGGGVNASNADWRTRMRFDRVPGVALGLDGRALFQALLDRGLASSDAARQFIRILLKAQRIPDRLVTDEHGRAVIEVKENGTWKPLDLDPQIIDFPRIEGFGN